MNNISRETLLTCHIALNSDLMRFQMMGIASEDTTVVDRIKKALDEVIAVLDKKVYMITDPCYVMDSVHYDTICNEQNCEFEKQTFPLKSKGVKTGTECVFHTIVGTPNGDGSYMFRGQDIGVDAGMLCIVEVTPEEAQAQPLGARFETLEDARGPFHLILSKF